MADIIKIRPQISAEYTDGIDGRDAHWYVEYSCPKCGRVIRWYKSDTACDKCGTFYDWGEHPPKLITTVRAEW